jgi:plasmid stabilization system protein ParE
VAEYWLRPKARSDIDAIWDYTIKTWGVQQARSYITELRDVCTELADISSAIGKKILKVAKEQGIRDPA